MDFSVEVSGNILNLIPSGYLTTNRQYTVYIGAGISGLIPPSGEVLELESSYTFWFTSIYCPQFSTSRKIRLAAGPAIDNFTDDAIYRMIHRNSLDAVDLFNLYNSTNVAYDYWGCDWQDIPLQMKRYVECKTAYDLLSLIKLNSSINGTNGNVLKTLGDMTIKYSAAPSSSSSGPNADPNKLRELYNCWQEASRMFKNISVAVKGYYDSSKGFSHPVIAYTTNRVLRPVIPFEGNYTPGTPYWRGI